MLGKLCSAHRLAEMFSGLALQELVCSPAPAVFTVISAARAGMPPASGQWWAQALSTLWDSLDKGLCAAMWGGEGHGKAITKCCKTAEGWLGPSPLGVFPSLKPSPCPKLPEASFSCNVPPSSFPEEACHHAQSKGQKGKGILSGQVLNALGSERQ